MQNVSTCAPPAYCAAAKEPRFPLNQRLDDDGVRWAARDLRPAKSQWHLLGVMLSVNSDTLSSIEASSGESNYPELFQEMLTEWLQQGEDTSWLDVAQALKAIGYSSMAMDIYQKYIFKINEDLTLEDLDTVEKELGHMVSQWYNLGIQLGVEGDKLKEIADEKNCGDYLRETLFACSKTEEGLTYGRIIEVLDGTIVGNCRLATEIKEKRII